MNSTSAYHLVLINVVMDTFNGEERVFPNLGLLSIATVAKERGYHTCLLTGSNILAELTKLLTQQQTRPLIGFSVNPDNYIETIRLCSLLKSVPTPPQIIVGGPFAEFVNTEYVESQTIDYICQGEGEYVVSDLLQNIEPEQIHGLTFLDSEGCLVSNAPAPITDLDELPIPDRTLLPLRNAQEVSNWIITSRGCGHRCAFCYESVHARVRYHSIERVIEELTMLKQSYQTKYFVFADSHFLSNPTRVRLLCQEFIEHFRPHEDFVWYCEGRVDVITKHPDLLALMKKAGLVRIQIGVESGSEDVLKQYNKKISRQQIIDAVHLCQEYDILSIYTNFILGGANENDETIQQTFDLMKTLFEAAPGRFECGSTFLSPYQGTAIEKNPSNYNIEIIDPYFLRSVSNEYVSCATKACDKNKIIVLSKQFTQQVMTIMLNQLTTLHDNLIHRHLAMSRFGIKTGWYTFLISSNDVFKNYNKFIQREGYCGWHEISEHQILTHNDSIFPTRTFTLSTLDNEYKLHIEQRKNVYDFASQLEHTLIELASGKLSITEISQIISTQFEGGGARHRITEDIITFYVNLAKECLVVFRTYPLSNIMEAHA